MTDMTVDLPPAGEAPTDTRKVYLSGPQWVTLFTLPGEDGATLNVNREGVDVPVADVDALFAAAAVAGVFLTTDEEASETP